jgi:hypothetical protein
MPKDDISASAGKIARFLAERLREPSSLRGIAMLLSAFGATLRPELAAAILAAGAALSGLLGVLLPDSSPSAADPPA